MRRGSTVTFPLLGLLAALMLVGCGGTEEAGPALTPTVTPSPEPEEFTERIAFVGTDGNVWAISPNGTDSQRLTTDGDNAQPSWSPDGELLAYIHARREVHLIRADGSQHSVVPQAQLEESCTNVIGFLASAARLTRVLFTPDGSGIRLGLDWGGIVNQFICHISSDTSVAVLPVVNGDEFGMSPVDGSLAYTRSGQGCAHILIADPDGEGEQQIGPTMGSGCTIEPEQLPGYPYAPTWSPDGEKIAFYSVAEAGSNIYVMDGQGAAPPQPIVSVSAPRDLQGGSVGLAWSPDGKRIAYEDEGGIWVISSDGTGSPLRVADGYYPSWGRVPAALRVRIGTGWFQPTWPSPSPVVSATPCPIPEGMFEPPPPEVIPGTIIFQVTEPDGETPVPGAEIALRLISDGYHNRSLTERLGKLTDSRAMAVFDAKELLTQEALLRQAFEECSPVYVAADIEAEVRGTLLHFQAPIQPQYGALLWIGGPGRLPAEGEPYLPTAYVDLSRSWFPAWDCPCPPSSCSWEERKEASLHIFGSAFRVRGGTCE